MELDQATQRQILAANPTASTWLSANAGSGKTRVLTDRVARLLLEGVAPQNILCLTYTKAAASEMQNRLFQRLGSWAMKQDADLRAELTHLGVELSDDPAKLSHARTLFARAVETPGGLKIQTIHSFCSSLLRRFPLEAGISPFFSEIEDRAASLLREEIVDEIANGDKTDVVQNVARHYSGENFSNLTQEIIKHRESFLTPHSQSDMWKLFDLPEGFSQETISTNLFQGGEPLLLSQLTQALTGELAKSTDMKAGQQLAGLDFEQLGWGDLDTLFSVFLTKASAVPYSAKIGKFPTKALRESIDHIMGDVDDFMARLESARSEMSRLLSAQKTLALYQFASVFLPAYEQRKEQRGWLDFDDLIVKARKLLTVSDVAQWVLFRLDGGLDHILVDEAQDTSPEQWRVIELLAQEFTAGKGAREDVARTIFVVGDKKQSIYSFQGADPKAFDEMREHFSEKLSAIDQALVESSLDHSFRSSSAILQLVDATFRQSNWLGVGGEATHIAFQHALPGRVDLWPVQEKTDAPEDREWYDPTDMIAANDHRVLLAEQIAEVISNTIKTGSIPDKNGTFRSISAGDFLILVQSRSTLFHEIIRACKAKDLPIAGADRLKIGAELAVKDVLALLSFLATPDDDLSLAEALRSPLFGFTEAQLYDLAHTREKKFLWQEMRGRQEDFSTAFNTLTDLRNQADFLSPYDLIERILIRHSGRENLLARLGIDAEDGLDALQNQALSYENTETPSLTGFLTWMAADEVEIKRQADSAGDRIRVMTTHGAKGLESPIVILPDTAKKNSRTTPETVGTDAGIRIWKPNSDWQPDMVKETLAVDKEADIEERMRLLYVALTRAETWLIICASGDVGSDGSSWYRLVESGLHAADASPYEQPNGQGLRLQHGDWLAAKSPTENVETDAKVALESWAIDRLVPPEEGLSTLTPSSLGGSKTIASGDTATTPADNENIRGSALHLLLERLPTNPEQNWLPTGHALLEPFAAQLSDKDVQEVYSEAVGVLKQPDLSFLFDKDSHAEIEVSANVPELDNRRFHGTIDRLLITSSVITVVDFKSNRIVPSDVSEIPIGLLRQIATYCSILAQIYPDREIRGGFLWTKTASFMPVTHDIVRQTLQATPIS